MRGIRGLLCLSALACALFISTGSALAAAPDLIAEPSSINFGRVPLDTSSGFHQVRFVNRGSANAYLSDVYVEGAARFEFGVDENCPLELEPGAECEFSIYFEPEQVGLREVVLVISEQPFSGKTEVDLSGEGFAEPEIAVTPTEALYAATAVQYEGETKAFVVQNTGITPLDISGVGLGGTAPDEFQITEDDCGTQRLAPGYTCEVQVQFRPSEVGQPEAELQIVSDAVNDGELEVPLRGEGLPHPVIEIQPASRIFEPTVVGSQVSEGFLVKNTGTTALHVAGATIGGANASSFLVGNDGCHEATLEPSEECGVIVIFEPRERGALGATLTVASDAADGEDEAALSGTGLAADATISPTGQDFGATFVGEESTARQFTITNTGSAPLHITGVELGGSGAAQFALEAAGCVGAEVLPLHSCTVEASFAPTGSGPATAMIEVESDSFEPDPTAALEGEAVTPVKELSIAPDAWDFGSVKVGGSATEHTFVIENTGDTPTIPASVDLSGPGAGAFTVSSQDCVGELLEPGDTCEVTADFRPGSAGRMEAEIIVGSEEGGVTPAVASLSGTGTAEGGSGGTKATPPAPWHWFGIKEVTRSRKNGTARLAIDFTGPGQVAVTGKGIRTATKPVDGGMAQLPIVPSGALKSRLMRTGKATVTVTVAFTAAANTWTKEKTLVLRLLP
jgi:hypothetical protein